MTFLDQTIKQAFYLLSDVKNFVCKQMESFYYRIMHAWYRLGTLQQNNHIHFIET